MKYNVSEIMKRAWEIKKQDNGYIFSECLKMAWQAEKYYKLFKEHVKEIEALEGLMAPEFYTKGDELDAKFAKVKDSFINPIKAQVKATFAGRSYKERKEASRAYVKATYGMSFKDEAMGIYFSGIAYRAFLDGMYELDYAE